MRKILALIVFFPALAIAGEAYNAAREAHAAGDYRRAVLLLEEAAQQEPISDFAEFFIGRNYHYGTYTERDSDKAVYWLTRAAEKGYAVAQYDLSNALRDVGEKEQAAYWLIKAGEQGLPAAYLPLTAIYRTGDGVQLDLQKACAWQMLVFILDFAPDEGLKCREFLSESQYVDAASFAARIRDKAGKYKKFEDN